MSSFTISVTLSFKCKLYLGVNSSKNNCIVIKDKAYTTFFWEDFLLLTYKYKGTFMTVDGVHTNSDLLSAQAILAALKNPPSLTFVSLPLRFNLPLLSLKEEGKKWGDVLFTFQNKFLSTT